MDVIGNDILQDFFYKGSKQMAHIIIGSNSSITLMAHIRLWSLHC